MKPTDGRMSCCKLNSCVRGEKEKRGMICSNTKSFFSAAAVAAVVVHEKHFSKEKRLFYRQLNKATLSMQTSILSFVRELVQFPGTAASSSSSKHKLMRGSFIYSMAALILGMSIYSDLNENELATFNYLGNDKSYFVQCKSLNFRHHCSTL